MGYDKCHDERSDMLYGLISRCVLGIYDLTTHPVLRFKKQSDITEKETSEQSDDSKQLNFEFKD